MDSLQGGAAERSAAPGGDPADPGGESLRVRLSWPDPAGRSDAAPAASDRVGDVADPAPPEDVPAEELPPAEVVTSHPQRPGADIGSSVGLIVDAYERLGSRLLSRLRDLRTDVDGDLAAVRSELAALRTAVEDVADRVQLRQMRSSIDELRSDVAGLRRAVLEWPELERVSSDLSALRAATAELQEQVARPPSAEGTPAVDWSAQLADLAAGIEALGQRFTDLPAPPTVADLAAAVRVELEGRPVEEPPRPDLAALAPLVEELVELRNEMEALRRRIALRAASRGSSLGPQDLDAIADAVQARIASAAPPR